MDLLRRELAPITPKAWAEIDAMAREALVATLSARKFVDVDGPHGIDHPCVNLGRLEVPPGQKVEAVRFGVHQVLPLVEGRVSFVLKQWELDNIDRGAKDFQLDALVEAARKIAAFEEQAVFKGFEAGCIKGLHSEVAAPLVPLELDMDAFVDAVSEGQARLLREGVEGPANLVVNPEVWKFLARSTPGGTLRSLLEKQLTGAVIYSDAVQGALLAAARGGDFELTIGQDFAIGYHHHTAEEIHLFITESFTFRVITPEALVGFEVKKKAKK
ncbi:family 1 encapsulin nanocompartment shell protein [Geoalkalibacter halelectricus]|uniref:Bacteriocin family protein n=1 Tax=Geoalkalibacter halelectricus TaxID=2847045 RepID=A0ABY5ZIB2_9BACT|nr:family 1 encapsulin nanocompartment shell protein [Geoalkalibacter halelectricus]MDO3378999.1 bacteriocin family protein [Geoalkalibacter halelectricus]UWZ78813.1 bacteriocin family protein [Geoalkalibacter halelectricus]